MYIHTSRRRRQAIFSLGLAGIPREEAPIAPRDKVARDTAVRACTLCDAAYSRTLTPRSITAHERVVKICNRAVETAEMKGQREFLGAAETNTLYSEL